ncbi:Membrane protein involved in the export of O-antigen and teichoic acid [Acidobacteriia bacterium SbA2]|nr:Membrane protein involved in the export of O-antigen and teichoic acid [Acidobacteriia bacterium SbA2]
MATVEIPAQPLARPAFHLGGKAIARNTAFNIVGQMVPLVVGVVTTPYVIQHLGPDRFGILALVWIVLGYFALFDLGIGPATTKFVAELLGQGEIDRIPSVVWTALATQSGMGLLAGVLLAASSPVLVHRILKIPAGLQPDTLWVFLTLAVSFPINFAIGSLKGFLSAIQRFDLVNAIAVPTSALWYVIPVGALALGFGLPGIALLLVVSRVVALAAHFVFCLRSYPALGRRCAFDRSLIRRLLSFGGWVTVSATVTPILVYLERFPIGALVSVAALAYYTPAYMISSRLGILPGSLTDTLFPAFSTSAGRGDSEWIRNALVRSLKWLMLVMGPAGLAVAFFARPVLTLWVGPKFAAVGTLPLQILILAVPLSSLGLVPSNLLQGIGRPDLTAKLCLAEAPVYVVLAWFLVSRLGLPGAALAWALRVSVHFVLLIASACWLTHTPARLLAGRDLYRTFLALAGFAAGLAALRALGHIPAAQAFFTLLMAVGFSLGAWRYLLDGEEKCQIRLWLRKGR